MSAEGTNLPQHITGAEQSQALQNVLLQQERAQSKAAAESSRDLAREQSTGRVQETQQVEDTIIEGEGGGTAPPYDPDRRPRGRPEGKSDPGRPPDPGGRGRTLDVEA